MKGLELAEVREAILSAYDKRKFDRLLRDRFDLRRENSVADGPFRDIVQDVIEQFEQEGRLAYLIAEIAADRPTKSEIQTIYDKYAAALLSDVWRRKVETKSAALLDRYGLLPIAELQLNGSSLSSRSPGDPAESPFGGFQKLIHAQLPELDVFQWSSLLIQQTCRVCRVELCGAPIGTGFLIGPATVLTSYHAVGGAIRAQTKGAAITLLFDYWKKSSGAESAGTRVAAREAWVDWHIDSSPPLTETEEDAGAPKATDEQLDHALIALERSFGNEPVVPGGPRRGWIEIPSTAPTLSASMPIAILHYPRTGPVKLTFDTRALQGVNAARTRMRYTTNTDEGSSGSPCFNMSLSLIGMHHFSDPHRKMPAYNQGIPTEAIYRRLARMSKLGALG